MSHAPVWDDRSWTESPPLGATCHTEACVIGLGGSGLAAIHALLDHGITPVGLDAGTVGGGAAGRNGGLLLAGGAPFHHDAVALWGAEAALAVHHATSAELNRMVQLQPTLIRRTGSLRIASSDDERADCERQLLAMRDHDLPVEAYHGAQGDGLCFPEDAVFQPLEYCRREATRAVARGAMLFERTRVSGVESGTVRTAAGDLHAQLIIVAVDGPLTHLLPALAARTYPVRLQMLATAPVDANTVPRPVYADFGYDYWQQLPDGRIVVGGGRNLNPKTEATTELSLTDEIQQHLEGLLRGAIGAPGAMVTHRWAGIVGYTSDERPIVTEVQPGVWAVGGYSGTGNLVGRCVGRGVVRLALDGDPSLLAGFLA